jgi:hypothetical protein
MTENVVNPALLGPYNDFKKWDSGPAFFKNYSIKFFLNA